MTVDELELMGDADELAKLAGLDDNRDPSTYNQFCARAQDLLEKWLNKGRSPLG